MHFQYRVFRKLSDGSIQECMPFEPGASVYQIHYKWAGKTEILEFPTEHLMNVVGTALGAAHELGRQRALSDIRIALGIHQ